MEKLRAFSTSQEPVPNLRQMQKHLVTGTVFPLKPGNYILPTSFPPYQRKGDCLSFGPIQYKVTNNIQMVLGKIKLLSVINYVVQLQGIINELITIKSQHVDVCIFAGHIRRLADSQERCVSADETFQQIMFQTKRDLFFSFSLKFNSCKSLIKSVWHCVF